MSVPKRLEHGHSPEQIRQRLSKRQELNYLRDWIYGAVDGAVTTFAVVSGVVGANLPPKVIIILGFANLVADGFSMAASNYLGTKAERDEYRQIEAHERRQIQEEPRGEREEVRQILANKGFSGEVLEKSTAIYTSDSQKWEDLMLTEEYGLPRSYRSAWKAAFSTFTAFLLCGFLPLLPYVLELGRAQFVLGALLTCSVFFLIGSLKSRWSLKPWWISGLETLGIGSAAAALAFAVGALFRG
ncbi:MAG: hypothetical protein A2428_16035 [Bdellovibrionales bacterium RIFOXYC1_FULL_54_43]|nr:MAG: hypothetical protein A2428_16035 [Bdellovibrionales bacterium RIFOXYC1_FULL_54_43]OFZ85160.1 MAG: hypothetical protein A2603_06310 [Bdellovibrionales bacterium RIFOXYD1_FULL_55_31]